MRFLEHPDGRALELEPWQRKMLELYERGGTIDKVKTRAELAEARRGERQQMLAQHLAIAALLEEPRIVISASNRDAAEDLYRRARDALETFGRATGVNVGPALERLNDVVVTPRR